MSFIDSKNNLDLFAKNIASISKMVDEGIKEYKEMDKEEFRLWLRYYHMSKSRW
jgi:hypothetical protein